MKKLFTLALVLGSVSAYALDVTVSWLPALPGELVTQYQIYSSTNALGPFTLTGTSTGTSFNTAVPDGLTTYFVITASNAFGQSNPSAVASLDVTNAPSIVQSVVVTHPFLINNVITINVNERLKK